MCTNLPNLQILLAVFSTISILSTNAFLQPTTTTILNQIPQQHITTKLWESPVRFAGTGARQVDMNQYNLDIETITKQWVANIIPKTVDDDGGIFLGVENDKELFPDVITVSIPRKLNSGSLGIGLQELAGGRSDGLGITIVTELVDGGMAQNAGVDILPGDSITSISVIRRIQSSQGGGLGLSDSEETITASTECLNYDATVDAILSLPPSQSDDEQFVIKLKRVRRKPIIKVNLRYPPQQKKDDETIELYAGENLRLGMLVRGVQLNDPLAKRFDTKSGGNCGAGGLCRTCAVSILRGKELLNPQKVAEKQMLQNDPRNRLGCKAFVGYGMKEGEITVQVNPGQW
jgi:ferredoxin